MQYISNIAVLARNLSILANFSYLDNFRYNCKITFLSAESDLYGYSALAFTHYLSILDFGKGSEE